MDIRTVFDRAVGDLGGKCLDVEPPPGLGVEFADYFFPDENVVAELKCLTEDSDPNEFHALLRGWAERGLIPPPPTGITFRVYTRDLPEVCRREFFHAELDRIRNSTIKKANRQIRQTKEWLGRPEARGLLFLANDGNFHRRPGLLSQLVIEACRDRFTSIDGVVIFTANFGTVGGDSPEGTRFWAPILLRGDKFDRSGIAYRIAAPFYKYYGEAAGLTMVGRERPAPSFSEVEEISYEGHPRPPQDEDANQR